VAELDYPDDTDGDALRRVASDGNDMSRPMLVDFAVVVPDERAGLRVAAAARLKGYEVSVERDEEEEGVDDEPSWTCYCSRTMVLAYDEVVAVQAELNQLSRPAGGYCDGWGTFGNREDDR
jgi:hypothetical protein